LDKREDFLSISLAVVDDDEGVFVIGAYMSGSGCLAFVPCEFDQLTCTEFDVSVVYWYASDERVLCLELFVAAGRYDRILKEAACGTCLMSVR
jgi:hypothetical protein